MPPRQFQEKQINIRESKPILQNLSILRLFESQLNILDQYCFVYDLESVHVCMCLCITCRTRGRMVGVEVSKKEIEKGKKIRKIRRKDNLKKGGNIYFYGKFPRFVFFFFIYFYFFYFLFFSLISFYSSIFIHVFFFFTLYVYVTYRLVFIICCIRYYT